MNALSSPKHVAREGFNVIPLEQRTEFTSTVGELLPIYYDLLYEGDKVTIDNVLRSRTMDLNSAAFCHLVEHIDWFAVPLDQLYRPFSNWRFGINDLASSFYAKETLRVDLPTISKETLDTVFPQIGTDEDFYFPKLRGTSLRLLELLGVPLRTWGGLVDGGTMHFPMNIAPWLFCAYQKIYMDYFRLSDRELNDPYAYNLDDLFVAGDSPSVARVKEMFRLRYRPFNKDFYTHLYVSPLMGAQSLGAWNVAVFDSSRSPLVGQFKQWLTSTTGRNVETGDSEGISDPTTPTQLSVQNDFEAFGINEVNPTLIRTSFAVEKLLEITRRAGKHVDQQLLAHMGVKVSPKVSGEVEHIAHFSSDIMIGDVIATAASENNAFGQVGGKGYGAGDGKFKWQNTYQCPVVLMAIYSCNPSVDYSVTGLERLNTYYENGDFFHLEFKDKGMQPQFAYQRNLKPLANAEDNSLIVGWQFPWMESKAKYNRVCGSLSRTLSFWTTRRALIDENVSVSSFLVNPTFLDTIMQKGYDFGSDLPEQVNLWGSALVEPWDYNSTFLPSSLFDSDPLIHEFYAHCNKATKMDAFGLPSL